MLLTERDPKTFNIEEEIVPSPFGDNDRALSSTAFHVVHTLRGDRLTHADIRVKHRFKAGLHPSSFRTRELGSNNIYLCPGLQDDAGSSSKHSTHAEDIKEAHPLLFQVVEFDQGEAIFKQPTSFHSPPTPPTLLNL